MTSVVVVGDAFLDRDLDGTVTRIAPDAPVPVVESVRRRNRPGGAALAAALAARNGADVTLVTALGDDEAGETVRVLLDRSGVSLVDLGLNGSTPEKIRIRAGGQGIVRVDVGGDGAAVGAPREAAYDALAGARAVLVADYGRGVSAEAGLRDAIAAAARKAPVVWDPHPRGTEPVRGVRLVTPNAAEAALFAPEVAANGLAGVAARAAALRERWEAAAVAVTLGDRGALLSLGEGSPLIVPTVRARSGDPCGAGDMLAATVTAQLANGALVSEAVAAGVVAASEFVAAGGAAAVDLRRTPDSDALGDGTDAASIIASVRSRGGTVVAAGGCFDLLHAGHVSYLEAARSLGDCLVVCINSDESTRRLKGAGRPLVPEADRAAVLRSLSCVDAVEIFDDDTPVPVLGRLRPDIFAKGGDYALTDLPEAALLASWGGQAVVLPYLDGRSTTALMKEAVRRAHH